MPRHVFKGLSRLELALAASVLCPAWYPKVKSSCATHLIHIAVRAPRTRRLPTRSARSASLACARTPWEHHAHNDNPLAYLLAHMSLPSETLLVQNNAAPNQNPLAGWHRWQRRATSNIWSGDSQSPPRRYAAHDPTAPRATQRATHTAIGLETNTTCRTQRRAERRTEEAV